DFIGAIVTARPGRVCWHRVASLARVGAMNAMIVPFTFLVVAALAWLVTLARLLTRLATYEPRTYVALGRPVLRLWQWRIPALAASAESEVNAARRRQDDAPRSPYLQRDGGANGTLLGFVVGGRHRML